MKSTEAIFCHIDRRHSTACHCTMASEQSKIESHHMTLSLAASRPQARWQPQNRCKHQSEANHHHDQGPSRRRLHISRRRLLGATGSGHQQKAGTTTSAQVSGRRSTKTTSTGATTTTRSLPPPCLLSSLVLLLLVCSLASMTVFAPTLVNGIKLQPEGKEKFYWSGEQFVITCQNNNNIKNVKIRWIGPDGSFITENRTHRIHAESSGPHGQRLVVMNATLGRDEGVYNCTIGSADNRTPLETAQFSLRLLRETNFKDTAKHLTLTAGHRGHIDCAVEFDPSVTTGTVTWFKNQQPIDSLADDSRIQVIEYSADRQMSQLILDPVKREHEDEYTCQAVAVTPHLSRILEYKIQVETHFAPIFDTAEQTIWVESQQAMALRLHQQLPLGGGGSATSTGSAGQHSTNQQAQTVTHRNMFGPASGVGVGGGGQRGRGGRPRAQQQQQSPTEGDTGVALVSANGEQIIRVELKCTVQANPEANIIWTTRSLKGMVVGRGQPSHVVEEPSQERSGHNTSSTLTVAYNLDPQWEFKRDSYICSASNKLDEAKKMFTIEQGNPPPAFLVGPHKSYNAETAVFAFTLVGPAVAAAEAGRPAEIVPPVDSFRIRAELGPAAATLAEATPALGRPAGGGLPAVQLSHQANSASGDSRSSYLKRLTEPSVQWTFKQLEMPATTSGGGGGGAFRPQNVTVNLGKLPSGTQRLYLEAHNAVGWSPNSTNLGEFYLVSGSYAINSNTNLVLMLACQLCYLVATSLSSFLNRSHLQR